MVSDKTNSIKRRLTSSSPSLLPTLPFDLILEVLTKLPVKSLLQFQCVCKPWKSLISDPKFAKKHLSLSTIRALHCITIRALHLVQLQLWNPSIRKFKELPPISKPQKFVGIYGFGYDPISDNYKVVLVSSDLTRSKNELKVHTLGTDSWKSVSEFPFALVSVHARPLAQYVSGTINWLVFMGIKGFICSFDLGNECYREVSLPDDSGKVDKNKVYLSVFRDCLCMISGEDVWAMKENGNKESWTKLFTISYLRDPRASSYPYIKAIRVFEDEQVLLVYRRDKRWRYISYNYKNDTSKFLEWETFPQICVESLISPCF